MAIMVNNVQHRKLYVITTSFKGIKLYKLKIKNIKNYFDFDVTMPFYHISFKYPQDA